MLIVDDHPMMRGLAQLIEHEPDLVVESQADSAAQALGITETSPPTCSRLIASLPDKNGRGHQRCARFIRPSILVVSMHDESLYAERVLRAGFVIS